jgi:NAD(P)H-hydrate epimerase
MRPVLSRDQVREFDRVWIERGVPGIVLMENAGRGAAHLMGLKARPRLPGEKPRQGSSVAGSCVRCADERSLAGVTILILAGSGNNGGDAMIVARHLAARGANVSVWGLVSGGELGGDAQLAWKAMEAVGIRLKALPPEGEWAAALAAAHLIVDGLLGTGAARLVEGRLARLIEAVNQAKPQVIALDIPSGLDAETGAVLGSAIRATHTVTFAHLKKGLLTTHGHAHAGNITVSHIGVPAELPRGLEPAAWLLETTDLSAALTTRSRTAHKGTAGRVAVVAGSPGTLGAARLSSRACLRSGAGLVTLLTDPATVSQLETEVVEVMTASFEDSRGAETLDAADAIVVGPGVGKGSLARGACASVWEKGRPTVVDADALRLVAEDRTAFLSQSERLFVLTPHPGEAAALLKTSVEEIEADRFAAAKRLSEELRAVVVLKGPRTIVAAPGVTPVVSAFGSPVLATAGSGDVLSGILGAFLVGATTTEDVFRRAQAGVGVHALCGERWESQHGDRGLLASELADLVPEVIAELLGSGVPQI